ncbi:MAG: dual specificity protein phosphatase family protein [Sedimentisphaerales bacterium]
MTPKKQAKAKSARLRYRAVLPAILVVMAGVFLVCKYGLPFGSQLGNYQRQAETIYAQDKWAERIELPGLPNLHKVSDDLYRGAQPTAEGMKQLEKLGVKTVVNLRSLHSDRDEIKDTGLAYEHINMTTWNTEDKDAVRFLRIVTDGSRTPVFVHCQHGADRTGTMCAIYHIAVQGWSKDEAIEEMTKGGFGFHSIWQNLPDYIRKLDVKEIKYSASLKE